MALVLIADDDDKLRDTLQTALTGEGHEVVAAQNGEEAVAAYDSNVAAGREPDIVVLDVLMPKLNGTDTAAALQRTGFRGHIIFMSGILKTAAHVKDAETRFGARGYLSKPFGNRRLLELIASLPTRSHTANLATANQAADAPSLGASVGLDPEALAKRQKTPLPAEGSLLECPVIHLIWRIESERHTGVLDLFGVDDSGRFRMFFFKGRLTMAQSSNPQHNLGVQLIRDGHLTGQMFEEAKATAIERGRGLHEVIKGEEWADDMQIKAAYRSLIPNIMADCIALSGQFRWTDSDAFSRLIPSAPVASMETACEALRNASAPQLEPHVTPRGPLRLAPGENWAEMTERLESACGSSSLQRSINGRASIAMLVNAARNETDRSARMRQVYLLMSTQSVIASEQPIPMEQPAAAPAPTPPPTPAPTIAAPSRSPSPAPTPAPARSPTPAPIAAAQPVVAEAPAEEGPVSQADQQAREKIREKLKSLEDKDEFGILDVTEESSPAEIKRTYFELAREFHTDSFAGVNLGPAALELDRLFALIAEAYDALTDPKKRAELDAKRMMEKAGMSTDVGALLEAENNFTKGQRLLERGEMIAAAKLFEMCSEVNPANTEWRCHKIYAQWWVTRDAARGAAVVKELETAFKEMPGVAQIAAFGGQIALESGDDRKARILFRKALNIDERNNIAVRGMRVAQQRKQEADNPKKSGGLMGFLKR